MNIKQTIFILSLFLAVCAKAQLLSFDKSTILTSAPDFRKAVYCANGDLLSVFTSSTANLNALTVIRYNQDGNLIWQSEYENSAVFSCSPDDVEEAANGDFIISISAVKLNFTTPAVGLMRISNQGILIWEKLYTSGSLLSDQFVASSKLTEASDGSIFLALSDINVSLNPTTQALILFRFSSTGNLLWGKGFGPTPPMNVVKLMKSPAGGVHIGANSNLNTNIHFIRVDSSGLVTSSVKFLQAGTLTDFSTDVNDNLQAILTTDFLNWTRLIELNSAGNVAAANEATIATTSWGTDLLHINGGFITLHEASGGGTLLCTWSGSPSITNGIAYPNSSLFTALDFFEGNDGSIYMSGISAGDPQTSKTRIIKTKPILANNFPLDGCSQTTVDFTIVSVTVSNPVIQTLIPSLYTPITETSSFQTLTLSANVTDNCTVVSVDEPLNIEFNLFPNPVSDLVTVSGNFTGETLVEVYSVTGEIVIRTSAQAVGNRITIFTDQLSEGVFLIKIIDAEKNAFTNRFVVSR